MTESETCVDFRKMAERYRQERDRRLRSDGTAQYRELSYSGELAGFLADPTHPEPVAREPVTRTIDVLVIGTGLSGIICAAELAKAGVTDILQIDSAGGFGGTWYWNRYPGVRCDTESYIYMPLLEDTGTIPTDQYATGEEISEQFERVARMYDLDRKALFQTRVTSMRWDEDASRWIVETNRGDLLGARFVIPATGRTHRLKLPGIPGVETFQGHSFHTGRWDYTYTGGGPSGELVNLRDKRVAIIGTGATAVQCIPFLAEDCRELYVVQRTPTAVAERSFAPTVPDFAEGLEPGWQFRRSVSFESLVNFEAMLKSVTHEEAMTDEGWASVWVFRRSTANRRLRSSRGYSPSTTSRRWSAFADESTRSSMTLPRQKR
jgi:cation diffusion facilitator CzcD-associated flavoprotein CzcO